MRVDKLTELRVQVFKHRHSLSFSDAQDVINLLSRYRRCLEGLTPGGSEFVCEPERCAEHVERQISDWRRRFKDIVIAGRKS